MKITHLLLIVISVWVLTSCKKKNAPDCFTPNGNDATESRQVSTITALDLSTDVELTIFKGAEQKLEVIAGEYIIDKISTSVTNGTLTIENNNKCNFVRGYKHTIRVNLTVPYITQVTNNGVGKITFDAGFKQDSVLNLSAGSSGDIYVNGSFDKIVTSSHGNGDLYFSGSTNQLNIYCNGTNYTYAQQLEVKNYIYISTFSLGDIYLNLNSQNTMDYYIMKDGNIYYTGTPASINKLSDGTAKGRLIKQD